MTITDLLSMPQGYTPEQWQKELDRKNKIEKKLHKLSVDLDFCLDGYAMTGKEKFKEQANQIKSEMDKLNKQL